MGIAEELVLSELVGDAGPECRTFQGGELSQPNYSCMSPCMQSDQSHQAQTTNDE